MWLTQRAQRGSSSQVSFQGFVVTTFSKHDLGSRAEFVSPRSHYVQQAEDVVSTMPVCMLAQMDGADGSVRAGNDGLASATKMHVRPAKVQAI